MENTLLRITTAALMVYVFPSLSKCKIVTGESIPSVVTPRETFAATIQRPGLSTDSGFNVSDPGNSNDGGDSGRNAKKDIWLVGLFPLKGKWPGGLGQLPAVQMGIDHVNADPNILREYRLQMTVEDTEVSTRTDSEYLIQ